MLASGKLVKHLLVRLARRLKALRQQAQATDRDGSHAAGRKNTITGQNQGGKSKVTKPAGRVAQAQCGCRETTGGAFVWVWSNLTARRASEQAGDRQKVQPEGGPQCTV